MKTRYHTLVIAYSLVCDCEIYISVNKILFIEGFNIKKVFIILKMNYICRLEKSTLIWEAKGFPVLLPTSEIFNSADTQVEGLEKEEELGIFQVLERLEEVTNMLTSR